MPKPNFRKKVKDENNGISTYSDKKISVVHMVLAL